MIYAVERSLQIKENDVYTLRGRRVIGKCTAEVRVADYFKALRQENLWPPSRLCISEIEENSKRLSEYRWHECSGERACILKIILGEIPEKIDVVVKNIEGISIKSTCKREGNGQSIVSYGYY